MLVSKGLASVLKTDDWNEEHVDVLFKWPFLAEVSEQTNGKACVLTEAARIVKDMGNQIECLRRDNAALLSESNYVSCIYPPIGYEPNIQTNFIQISYWKILLKTALSGHL